MSQQEGMACPKETPAVPLLCGDTQQRQDCELCQASYTRAWRDADEQDQGNCKRVCLHSQASGESTELAFHKQLLCLQLEAQKMSLFSHNFFF